MSEKYIKSKQSILPFQRELFAASSRGRYGNAFSVTGVCSMNEKTQRTWHWQVEAYDVSKWASVGIKGHLWNTSPSFLSSGYICFWSVSIVNVLGGVSIRVCAFWHQMTHTTYAFCVWDKLRARALCSRGNGVRSVHCELFSFFFPLSFIPFLERIWSIIWPPRLGSSRCWGSNETEIGGIADGACWRVSERN